MGEFAFDRLAFNDPNQNRNSNKVRKSDALILECPEAHGDVLRSGGPPTGGAWGEVAKFPAKRNVTPQCTCVVKHRAPLGNRTARDWDMRNSPYFTEGCITAIIGSRRWERPSYLFGHVGNVASRM